MNTWPLFFPDSLARGIDQSSVAVCCLWTPQDHALARLETLDFAAAGNLYSREGVSFLLRNLLARPSIRTLVLCGKDLTGSGAALVALFAQGIDDDHRVAGEGTRIHQELPREAIDALRAGVRLVDARGVTAPAQIAALVRDVPNLTEPYLPEPLVFPYTEPAADELPAETTGTVLRGQTVRQAYLRLIREVMTFGRRGPTEYGTEQRELLDVMTVVSAEPTDLEGFSFANWMPFSREQLGGRGPDGRWTGYLGQVLAADTSDGVRYTYGERLHAFHGQTDQVAAIAAALRATPFTRRAVAGLWDPALDLGNDSPPCLNLVQVTVRDGRLHLTAYFRSHDIFRAWAANAFALRALQVVIAEQVGECVAGDLVIVSQSAHIYAHDWEAAQSLLERYGRTINPRLTRDPRGSFVITIDGERAIVVDHYGLDGSQLRRHREWSAAAMMRTLAPFVSEIGHALYLGGELQKAELAIRCGCPERFRQDEPFEPVSVR